MKRLDSYYLYFTCFSTGFVILVLEILGFRLFAPFFGSSVYVTGSLIGVVLGALSVGYYLGGACADRYPRVDLLYGSLLAAGIYMVPCYLRSRPILVHFQGYGMVYGALLAALVIFGVPMLLLSMVSPSLIRLLGTEQRLGVTSGAIFSLSTVGSILGSFLTTFYLIPRLGSKATFLLAILVTVIVAVGGLSLRSRRNLGLMVLSLPLLASPATARDPRIIYQTDSLYSVLYVYEDGGARWLAFNNPIWMESYTPLNGNLLHTYREYFNLAPYLTEVSTALVLGMSAGASVQQKLRFTDMSVDAVEIDPKVVELADKYFGTRESGSLRIHVEDARSFLARTGKKYDFIEVDLFQGGPNIPFYVVTEEFFRLVRERLTDRGIMMMNVLGVQEVKEMEGLVASVGNTVASVFPTLFHYHLGVENTLFLATARETTRGEIAGKLARVDEPLLYPFAASFARGVREYVPDRRFDTFTDDKAPIEGHLHRAVEALLAFKARG